MRVRIYRNLNKGGLSVQTKQGKSWKVTDYVLHVVLTNCIFKVREGGRQKVLKDKQKNVHAYVEGDLLSTEEKTFLNTMAPEPYYNPYKQNCFTINGKPVDSCGLVKVFSPQKSKKTRPKKSKVIA